MKRNKKGISLIVLVITIVVIIILAAAVILSLGKNNPINSAKEAKVRQSMDTFESDLGIQVANKLLKDTTITVSDITSKDQDGWRVTDLIPSIKGTEYENQLIVENGKIKLKDGSTLPETTQDIIKEYLGQGPTVEEKIITKEMIEANPSAYIGKTVSYTGYSESKNTIDWRLFGFDEAGNIMLKANDYIDLSYKTLDDTKVALAITTNNYKIKGVGNRDNLISYIGNEANWSEFVVEGKTTARGAMTLPEFVYGYNLVNEEKLEVTYLTAGKTYPDSTITAIAEGYVIKKGTGSYTTYVSGITQAYKGMKFYDSITTDKAAAMWLASLSSDDASDVMCVNYGGNVNYFSFDGTLFGLRSLPCSFSDIWYPGGKSRWNVSC